MNRLFNSIVLRDSFHSLIPLEVTSAEMKLLFVLTVGVLCGFAHCNRECFKRRQAECNREVLDYAASQLNVNFCNYQKKLLNCLTVAASDCDMGFFKQAEWINGIVDEVCTEGTGLHEEFEEHKECYTKAATDIKCYQPIIDIMKNKETPKDILRGQKEACKQLSSLSDCLSKSAEKSCGLMPSLLFDFILSPLVDLHKDYCEEVIFPENENLKRSVHSDAPNYFELLAMTL
ncbi:hypothetical protein CDAR_60671 [Caerostris darwini]|uniref:DUF19 domain-containing protein n=1 Tax=Caerostris darwini TaxID=1538125 RepID=A0AAV4VKI0_9ARAC|nr:hypothetical protein CDAR_60671 [Caerostris darwini]